MKTIKTVIILFLFSQCHANLQNVNILNATDTQQTYSKHTKMKIDLGDTLNAIFIPTPEFKDGTFSQTLAKGTYDKETE
ncbi:MAG TPA: hypothetical protein VLZ29_02265, partial [Sulfurimonas sp.]|uniref:hypothetical protein n=1 Tax=Sulfurimonas sp. TaxID=2022749 RepID=UPI002CCA285B